MGLLRNHDSGTNFVSKAMIVAGDLEAAAKTEKDAMAETSVFVC